MFDVTCASCASPFEYNPDDYIHLCPFCSAAFIIDFEEGAKDLVGDHYIVPNQSDKAMLEKTFYDWINERYHRPDKIKSEFDIIGSYGIALPYWVVSLEAHTFWSGYSKKEHTYPGQSPDFGSRFAKEEGQFSRRYRWAILARRSPKEHWGLERLHRPKENVLVDWDGFPFDEAMGRVKEADKPQIYQARLPFKFENASGVTISGVQVKETLAISRTKDQIQEYHRRICKTKVGSLYDHRTEIEVIGIHLVHIPFWILRYSYSPKSAFKYLTKVREKRLLIQGYTHAVLEAEMPLNVNEKIVANMVICGVAALSSLFLATFVHPLFLPITFIFSGICFFSMWKIKTTDVIDDVELKKGKDISEPVGEA